ncbi:MAG: hscB [Myxococcaceae bacterium]|nr:hscB [Myxococcaceae bacterium]
MDPFAVLGIERQYAIDLKDVEKRHRDLSRTLHPDKYAGSGAHERNSALSNAVEVNEAWRIVRDPVKRGEALFRLAGITVGDAEPKAAQSLLMEMMELRETLEAAKDKKDLARVRALGEDIERRAKAAEAALGIAFREAAGDKAALEPHVAKLGELRFYRRFLEEVESIEDRFLEGDHTEAH